jgi:hypothetical protein
LADGTSAVAYSTKSASLTSSVYRSHVYANHAKRRSPGGATYQREEQRFNLRQVSHLRLSIVPNKNGSGTATLTALRLFA